MKSKLQSAMEYLMTYGWAILVISIVLGALASLGIVNPYTFEPKAQPGSCQVYRPYGPGTNQYLSLVGTCTGLLPEYVASFNGQNQFMAIQSKQILSPVYCNLTIVAWSYDMGMNGYGGVISLYSSGAPNSGWDDIEYSNTNLRFELRNQSSGNAWWVSQNFQNRWIFTALVLNNGHPTGYINGINYPGGAKYIGCIGNFQEGVIGTWDSRFNGYIANIQIYNTSLSANEIQALYQEGIGGVPIDLEHLVAWYPLNGNANDYSGNGNNAQIAGNLCSGSVDGLSCQSSGVLWVSTWESTYTPP